MSDIFKTTAKEVVDAHLKSGAVVDSNQRKGIYTLCPSAALGAMFEAVLKARRFPLTPCDIERDLPTWMALEQYIGPQPVADFDLVAKRHVVKQRMFSPAEAEYALGELGKDPSMYMGVNLLFRALNGYFAAGEAAVAPIHWFDQGWDMRKIYGRLEENTSPRELVLLPMAVMVAARREMRKEGAMPSNESVVEGLRWFFRARGFYGNGRVMESCPAKDTVIRLLTLPLFKGTKKEAPALVPFAKKAKKLAAENDNWEIAHDWAGERFAALRKDLQTPKAAQPRAAAEPAPA